ncbi:hypothetical protein D8674_018758 [Pyrus ussuriensis x Pyrus communis]|uniref:Uncharacterized protein n=1 Tax=Pyrus ussuriensis x Pyrus communis TaxID=2448454 RepID=A0A5N5G5T2_9ROSA|nr:hypothetical protein D8674_018758 [Pyrus ussuriensis x Pyrus communis]
MQELLDLRQNERTGRQLMNEIRKQANDVLQPNSLSLLYYAMSMPYRIQRIEEFVKDRKSARKAAILHMVTMYTVLGGTLVNLGDVEHVKAVKLSQPNGSFIGAGNLLLKKTLI